MPESAYSTPTALPIPRERFGDYLAGVAVLAYLASAFKMMDEEGYPFPEIADLRRQYEYALSLGAVTA